MSDGRLSSLGCSILPDVPIESLRASAGPCRSNAMRIFQSISRAKEETSQILKGSSNKRCCVSNMVMYRTTPNVVHLRSGCVALYPCMMRAHFWS